MNPIFLAALRRNWRLTGAIAALLVFTAIHFALFRPAAAKYRTALASVGGIEAVFNPAKGKPMLPPRVFALIADHSLTPQDAADRGGSGALGVVLLEDIGRAASRAGLEVGTSEPGAVTQQPLSVLVRAHLKLRGRYPQIVAFFDELSKSESLMLVDKFKVTPDADADQLEIWISRLYLKRAASKP